MKVKKLANAPKLLSRFVLAVGSFGCLFFTGADGIASQPFQLGAEANEYIETGGGQYPAPQYVQPQRAPVQGAPLSGGAQSNAYNNPPPRRPVFQGNATAVSLPAGFLGAWMVRGSRQRVEAMPEFQDGAERAFAVNNQQIWNITGSPGNYMLGSNTGIQTSIYVDKVAGSTAFVRYQHPVGHTMAQEAIVISLQPGGAQFNGLERVSIVKEGLPQPRAKVTYQLVGLRQR